MKTFSIKEAFHRAWEQFKTHKKVLVFAALISIAINIAMNSGPDGWSLWSNISYVVFYIISLWVTVGFLKITLNINDGTTPDLKELYGSDRKLIWKYFLVTVCYGLVVTLGLILLIVPGIYFAMKYLFAPLLVVDKNLSVGEAFKESARLTLGIKWKLLGLCGVSILILILGFIALGVGLAVAIPVVQLMYVDVYRKLLSKPEISQVSGVF
ncbi:MAG: hypothetical protein WAX80_03050 [Minisyncoccia bacterium]